MIALKTEGRSKYKNNESVTKADATTCTSSMYKLHTATDNEERIHLSVDRETYTSLWVSNLVACRKHRQQ